MGLQYRIEQELAEAERKEKEHADNERINKEKQVMQLKLKKNLDVGNKMSNHSPQYGFDMLQTDDETDDESKLSKKRPQAPEWSLRKLKLFYILNFNSW